MWRQRPTNPQEPGCRKRLNGFERSYSQSGIRRNDVSGPTHRVDQLWNEITVNLIPQTFDNDIDDVAVGIKVHVPNLLDDFHSRKDFLGVVHKKFQYQVLFRSQSNRHSTTYDATPLRVNREIRDRELADGRRGAAAAEGAHACQQFSEIERLRQIVVSAAIQTGDLIRSGSFRRQEQNGNRHSPRPQIPAEVSAVTVRQHAIDDEKIVILV